MPKSLALREAKDWLRNLTTKEATEQVAALTTGVTRGSRGEIKLKASERIKADKPSDKPFADPHYWSVFILFGEAD